MAVVDESALAGNRALIGTEVEVLVAAGEGRKDEGRGRLTGRARDGRLVHFTPVGAVDRAIRPGDVVTTTVTYAAPHHLVADSDVLHPPPDPGRGPIRGRERAADPGRRARHARPRPAGVRACRPSGLRRRLTRHCASGG